MDRKHPNAPTGALITPLMSQADEALRRVRESAPWVPPLDVAEDVARQTLAAAEAINYDLANTTILAAHVGALSQALRQILDALDAEAARS